MAGSEAKKNVEGLLDRMGVLGWGKLDLPVLVSLLTGDSVLLVGTHGTCKTYLCYRLADALGVKFQAYDASKSLFEDIIGFPSIDKYKEGKVEYIPTPLTIWDKEFLLIDELNRANANMQNKWLEVIRSRRIMGVKTDVKWCFAAMNPRSYSGTHPLDLALLNRFSLFIEVPEITNSKRISPEQGAKIVMTESVDDTKALPYWLSDAPGQGTEDEEDNTIHVDLCSLMRSAAIAYKDIKKKYEKIFSQYVYQMVMIFAEDAKYKIDGRRGSMIRRSILAALAIQSARGLSLTTSEIESTAKALFALSLPVSIDSLIEEGEALGSLKDKLNAAHEKAKHLLADVQSIKYRILNEDDPLEKSILLMRITDDPAFATNLVKTIFAMPKDRKTSIDMEDSLKKVGIANLLLPFTKFPTVPAMVKESIVSVNKTIVEGYSLDKDLELSSKSYEALIHLAKDITSPGRQLLLNSLITLIPKYRNIRSRVDKVLSNIEMYDDYFNIAIKRLKNLYDEMEAKESGSQGEASVSA